MWRPGEGIPALLRLAHVLAYRAVRAALEEPAKRRQRALDFRHATHASSFRTGHVFFEPPERLLDSLAPHRMQVAEMAGHFLAHRFDLLGSGWVEVRHGMHCSGFEGRSYAGGPGVEADGAGRWLDGRLVEPNLAESTRVWRLVQGGTGADGRISSYTPIDWQLDFKSGFRWSERSWYRDIRHGKAPGSDVKVPWELGRMQHLLQFAWAFVLSKDDGAEFQTPDVYLTEFRSQVLDFIATNPPRFGVQWACTMEVAIRVCNWLVSYGLLRAFGADFDADFERVFWRSVTEHGEHIAGNLEWGARLRHNHYLANVLGLLFAAAYLAPTRRSECWLAFAVRELASETSTQFFEEGASFEGSTCYHRLSAEMAAFGAGLVLGLPRERLGGGLSLVSVWRQMGAVPLLISIFRKLAPGARERRPPSAGEPLPAWFAARLRGMAEFTTAISKQSGHVVQIGDNDSGRFLKAMPACTRLSASEARGKFSNLATWVAPAGVESVLIEDHLNHGHLVETIRALLPEDDSGERERDPSPDACLLLALSGGRRFGSLGEDGESRADAFQTSDMEADVSELEGRLRDSSDYENVVTEFDVPPGPPHAASLRAHLRTHAFPEFGLYVWKSARLFLAIRCGPAGRSGQGGHSHNDQLAVELEVDGVDWVADPGSYVYTADPEKRDLYRSVRAHFAPQAGSREPSPLSEGLFSLPDWTRSEAKCFGPRGFAGLHHGYGVPTYRVVAIEDFKVRVSDFIPRGLVREGTTHERLSGPVTGKVPFSSGYGIVET